MIEVNATIKEYTEEGVEYKLKEYDIISSYPNSVVKILLDGLFNQTFTNEDGVAILSTGNLDEHNIKVTIKDETVTDTL